MNTKRLIEKIIALQVHALALQMEREIKMLRLLAESNDITR